MDKDLHSSEPVFPPRPVKEIFMQNPYVLAVIGIILAAIPFIAISASNDQTSAVTNAQVAQTALYVSPNGLDTNSGDASAPLKTIQAALNKAAPGITINVGEGTYRERIYTKVNGTESAPITIKGPETGKDKTGRYKAVLHGTSRIVNVDHNYYVFEGFTIDGQEQLVNTTYPTTLAGVRTFKDNSQGKVIDNKLIYIGSGEATKDLTGIVVRDMYLNGAGGECIRMRNNAHHNVVTDSVITWCGMFGKGDDSSQYKYHNAEGVYIGTSPKSTDQPMAENDGSSFNVIKNNTIYTFGSECFQVKENAHDNIFENNDCRYNDEPYNFLGSNIELRGYNNTIIGNTIQGSRGIGLKMKSDSSEYVQGGNIAQNNNFSQISNESIRNDQNKTQGLFCGNTFTGTILVGASVGNPTAPCPGSTIAPTDTVAPTATTMPPTVTPTRINTPTPTIPVAQPTNTPTAGDTLAPIVSITSPVNGSSVKKGTNVTLSATASDNVGVNRVTFAVNNAILCTDTSAPYSCSWSVPNKPNISYTIKVQAFDTAGNNKTSTATVTSSK